jgi:Bacterial-like globin
VPDRTITSVQSPSLSCCEGRLKRNSLSQHEVEQFASPRDQRSFTTTAGKLQSQPRADLHSRARICLVLLLSEGQVIDELYDLIGGRQTVWAATESFHKRVYADDALRPFFKTTDMVELIARQSMFISMLLGDESCIRAKISGNHGSIWDSWPIAFSGYPRGPRVGCETGARSTQRLTTQLRLAL